MIRKLAAILLTLFLATALYGQYGKKEKKPTIIGEGDLDILGCLMALKALKYDSILAFEYEENPENPMSDLEVGLKNVRTAAAKLG